MRYRTRQHLQDLLRRRGAPPLAALVLWSVWTAVTVALAGFYGELGMLLALILLGGIVFLTLAFSLLWLRREVRRERQQDAKRLQDLLWLSAKLAPRRPLPLWLGGMARVDLLDCLRQCIDDKRPLRVLELGSGLSSLVMAYALQANGQGEVIALEDNAAHAINSRRLLAEHGLCDYAHVLDAPLIRLDLSGQTHQWYTVSGLPDDGDFDILFVDGPAGHLAPNMRYPALPVLRARLAPDALIVVDDADRRPERLMIEEWLQLFPEIERDEALSGTGFTVLRVGGAALANDREAPKF